MKFKVREIITTPGPRPATHFLIVSIDSENEKYIVVDFFGKNTTTIPFSSEEKYVRVG
jgi:hypothetical protein